MTDTQFYILIAAAVVGLGYLLWEAVNSLRARRAQRKMFARSAAAAAPPPSETAGVSEEDRHAAAAAEVTRKMEAEAREAQRRHEQELAAVHARLEKARRLVRESGLAKAAGDLLRMMWEWPELASRDRWARPAGMHELHVEPADAIADAPPPEQAPDGGPTADADADAEQQSAAPGRQQGEPVKAIAWQWQGQRYRLDLHGEQTIQDDGSRPGTLGLEVGGQRVLVLVVAHPDRAEPNTWRVIDVDEFHAGDWMAPFIEFAGQLRLAEEEKQRLLHMERDTARAGRIDLEDD